MTMCNRASGGDTERANERMGEGGGMKRSGGCERIDGKLPLFEETKGFAQAQDLKLMQILMRGQGKPIASCQQKYSLEGGKGS